MSYVIGNVACIMTKSLSLDITSAKSWNSKIALSNISLDQVSFWKTNISKFNSRPFCADMSVQKIIYSDASNTGFGGYIVHCPNSVAHGLWAENEKSMSSTWKELEAVRRILVSLLSFLKGKHIKWFTDNQNVVSIVNKGSMKSKLQEISYNIYLFCLKNHISLDVEWIPRSENEIADYCSRIIDPDDWCVSRELFDMIDRIWGPHEIDWFASSYSKKVNLFCSRYWQADCMCMDAFTVHWGNKNGWFCPPICMLSRVLLYMQQCCAYGTVILPNWPSSNFWPILCPNGNYIKAVKDSIVLPSSSEFYSPGRGDRCMFGKIDLPFRMLALRIDYRSD